MEVAQVVLEYLKVLIWPIVLILLCIYFKPQVVGIFERIKSATLPGGISIELTEKIREVKELSSKLRESISEKIGDQINLPIIPANEANNRLKELGLNPSPSGMDMDYYREIAKKDPNLALAGLRIEFDIMTKNLAKGSKIEIDEKRDSGTRLLKKLIASGSISKDQFLLATKVLNLCNSATHGAKVTLDQALLIIDSADVLVDDYLAWMSWGFDDYWISSRHGS